LESLIYTLVFLAKGSLPWDYNQIDSKGDPLSFHDILNLKKQTIPEETCAGLPIEYAKILSYIRGMGPHEAPNYKLISEWLSAVGSNYDTPTF